MARNRSTNRRRRRGRFSFLTKLLCILLIAGAVVAALTVLGIWSSRAVLVMMGTPEDVLGLSVIYLRIYFIGIIALSLIHI